MNTAVMRTRSVLTDTSVSAYAGFWRRLAAHMIDYTLAVVAVGVVLVAMSAFTKPPLESKAAGAYLGGLITVDIDVEQRSKGAFETRTEEMVTTRVAGLPIYLNRHHVVYHDNGSSIIFGHPSPLWIGGVAGLMLLFGALFEGGKLGATPGKLAMGLKVVGEGGAPLSYSQSLLRQMAKLASAAALTTGFIMIGVTKRKQGLHDKIASALVLRNGA